MYKESQGNFGSLMMDVGFFDRMGSREKSKLNSGVGQMVNTSNDEVLGHTNGAFESSVT